MKGLIVLLVIALVVFLIVTYVRQNAGRASAERLDDAKADARQSIERLGGQVYSLDGRSDPAATQSLADASERFTAAGSQVDQATSPAQARLAKQTALEGLYYIRAARSALHLDPGPPIGELDGQSAAGSVTEDRSIDFEGRRVDASPNPSGRTPNYYPGGRVAGRPVPAGWYSEPWWRPAMVAGAWGIGSAFLFTSLFSGMSGVHYDTAAFESGAGEGGDMGPEGDAGAGGDLGGGEDFGGDDFGGGDFGGGDFGGGFGDFGGF
ncbi:DUF1542 domain-containing protein [Gordonia zhaorongruii]|uniref:DUF1542 domain-containing protein n=1 Tax=Gordonia zhaorongruii TaxID=2597659 RepID=UPI0010525507|nr:DUF1542 domain-containing protein [Gordonia zhaorongruii]